MLDTATLSEIVTIVGLITTIVTLAIFIWSQRKSIDDIKTTVETIQTDNRVFHTHIDTSLGKYDMTLDAMSREDGKQSEMMASLITSHSTTQVSIDYMQKMFDNMSRVMGDVTTSVNKLSIVIDNQSKATDQLIVILKSHRFN